MPSAGNQRHWRGIPGAWPAARGTLWAESSQATGTFPGARILAADLVVSCVRQIRGLRGSAGLVRQAVPAVVSGGDRETRPSSPVATTPKAAPASGKRPLPAPPPPPKPVKGESYSEEEEEGEEEVEEESPSPSHRPLGGAGDRRPPEPDHPPSTLTRTSQ